MDVNDGGNKPFEKKGREIVLRDEKRVDGSWLIKLLGGEPGDDVLDVLEQKWSGKRSFGLEESLRKSGIQFDMSIWSG